MALEIRQDKTTVWVDVQDEMTIYTAVQHWEQLLPLLVQAGMLELDLSAVPEMDSAGIQLLLALQQESQRLNKRFRLCRPSAEVMELLQLLRLERQLLAPHRDVEEAE